MAEANRQGSIASTKNCSVSVLVKRNNNDTGDYNINQFSDLENVKNPIKRENNKKKYCPDDDNNVDDDKEKSPNFKKSLSADWTKKLKDV